MISIDQIENALIAVLREKADKAYYVETYDGPAGDVDALMEWISGVQLPSLAVFYAGSNFEKIGEYGTRRRVERSFEVWFVLDQIRSLKTAKLEQGGLYELLGKANDALWGSAIGLAVEPLECREELELVPFTGNGRVVWAQRWIVTYNE